MRQILIIFLTIASICMLQAQCEPDTSQLADGFPIAPTPYDPGLYPDGGIKDTACLNEAYETVLTFLVPDTLGPPISTTPIPLSSIGLQANGFTGLPDGLDYTCNPPSCVFNNNEPGCVIISGTPSSSNATGNYPLAINAVINGAIPFTFSNGVAGEYSIFVKEEGSCLISSANDLSSILSDVKIVPNPFSTVAHLIIRSDVQGEFTFEVTDLVGKSIQKETITVFQGENTINFHSEQFSEGVYLYSIRNQDGIRTGKMVVRK